MPATLFGCSACHSRELLPGQLVRAPHLPVLIALQKVVTLQRNVTFGLCVTSPPSLKQGIFIVHVRDQALFSQILTHVCILG